MGGLRNWNWWFASSHAPTGTFCRPASSCEWAARREPASGADAKQEGSWARGRNWAGWLFPRGAAHVCNWRACGAFAFAQDDERRRAVLSLDGPLRSEVSQKGHLEALTSGQQLRVAVSPGRGSLYLWHKKQQLAALSEAADGPATRAQGGRAGARKRERRADERTTEHENRWPGRSLVICCARGPRADVLVGRPAVGRLSLFGPIVAPQGIEVQMRRRCGGRPGRPSHLVGAKNWHAASTRQ